jgi:outer membrane protein OmpA-like peptidoglycan-associated protein
MKGILTVLFIHVFLSFVWAEDCAKAVKLYNQATLATDLASKENLFKRAIPLCTEPEVLSKIHNNLADTYEKTGRLSPALDHYRKALETKPDFALAYFSVGDIFFRLRDYRSAAVMYDKGLRYAPDDHESQKRKEEAEARAKKFMIIYFDFDSFEIPNRYATRLRLVCKAIEENGIQDLLHIKITGHTCDIGPRSYNNRLSLKRAEEVARYFEEALSTHPQVLIITPAGENGPLLKGWDSNARILNRRVEIQVLRKEK